MQKQLSAFVICQFAAKLTEYKTRNKWERSTTRKWGSVTNTLSTPLLASATQKQVYPELRSSSADQRSIGPKGSKVPDNFYLFLLLIYFLLYLCERSYLCQERKKKVDDIVWTFGKPKEVSRTLFDQGRPKVDSLVAPQPKEKIHPWRKYGESRSAAFVSRTVL